MMSLITRENSLTIPKCFSKSLTKFMKRAIITMKIIRDQMKLQNSKNLKVFSRKNWIKE